jgi:hypothetical protein
MEADTLSPAGACNGSGGLACGDDGSLVEAVSASGTYLIRVGADGLPAEGKAFLSIECRPICGAADAAECCPVTQCLTDVDCTGVNDFCDVGGAGIADNVCVSDTLLGCTDTDCCLVICADDAFCCGGLGGTWDASCVLAARNESVCECGCQKLPAGGSIEEGEHPVGDPDKCDQATDINSGCAGVPDTNLYSNVMCGQTIHGTTWADGGARDLDYYAFDVSEPGGGDGKVVITVTVFVADATACATPCDDITPCPAGKLLNTYNCDETAGFCNIIAFDSLFTASCDATDDVDTPITMDVCVPVTPGTTNTYHVIVAPTDSEGVAVFTGNPCGSQSNDYNLTIGCDNAAACPTGACCGCTAASFPGGCRDNDNLIDCFNLQGSFNEGETCATVDPPCTAQRHGCGDVTEITLTPNTPIPGVFSGKGMANLTDPNPPSEGGTEHPPDEPYPCANAGADPDDSAWFKVTLPAGVTSLQVLTCGSSGSGRDSIIGVYEGTCCDPLNPFRPVGCSDDECGFTGFLGQACAQGLTPGQTYWFQVSNFFEPINGEYQMDIHAPCIGSCCNSEAAVCQDNVIIDDCAASKNLSFSQEFACSELNPACGRGACCRSGATACTNNLSPLCCRSSGGACTTEADCPVWNNCVGGACVCGCAGRCTQAPLDITDCPNATGCNASGACTCTTAAQCPPGNSCTGGVCVCTSVTDGLNHFPGAVCDTATTIGYICNPFDQCTYDHTPTTSLGFTSQYFTDLDQWLIVADNFMFKGAGDPPNACFVDVISYETFHTNHQTPNCNIGSGGPTCADRPSDYQGIWAVISNDAPSNNLPKNPTCDPAIPTTDPPTFVGNCKEVIEFGAPAGEEGCGASPTNCWQWSEDCTDGQCEFFIDLHFNPPLVMDKNKKNWLSIIHKLPLTDKYQVIWFATRNYDGRRPRGFNSAGPRMWEELTTDPQVDLMFNIPGIKETPFCGPCQLYADVCRQITPSPYTGANCIVESCEVGKLLAGYAAGSGACLDASLLDTEFKFLDACPQSCNVDADCPLNEEGNPSVCTTLNAGEPTESKQCCGVVEAADLGAVLDAYAYNFGCPAKCDPGACLFNTDADANFECCKDRDYFPDGMSEGDCNDQGGTWQGPNTICSSFNICDPGGNSVCNYCP